MLSLFITAVTAHTQTVMTTLSESTEGANTEQLCNHISYESWSRCAPSFTRAICTTFPPNSSLKNAPL